MADFRIRLFIGLALVVCPTPCLRAKTSASVAVSPPSKSHLTYKQVWRKSSSHFSGDVFLLPKRGNFLLSDKDFKLESMRTSSVKGRPLPPHPMTMHGMAWDYDLEIPIAFYDPTGKWFKPGVYLNRATQQDIAPTISHLLGIPSSAKIGGRVLRESLSHSIALQKSTNLPKAIVIFVQDQAGRQYYGAHPGKAPFLEHLTSRGANFKNAAVSHVDVETSVGHTAIGTGAWPPETGNSGNDFFHPGLWKQLKAFTVPISAERKDNLVGNPGFLMTPTFADVWTTVTDGKAIIFSQVYAPRAAIGMAGHGATFLHGKKTHVVWMNESDSQADVYETDENIYSLPASHRTMRSKPHIDNLTKDTPGKWRGLNLYREDGSVDSDAVKASPAQSYWEAELAKAAIQELKIGTDDVTDLVFINTKATDACGHLFGFESDECGEVLTASDQAAKEIVDVVSKQTDGNYFVVLTADHGAAPLPEMSGATRYSRDRLTKDLNQKFDRSDNRLDVVLALTSSQLYLNRSELAANGHKVSDVVSYLKSYRVPFESPFNVLANEWIKKGKPPSQLFFQDVVAKEDL